MFASPSIPKIKIVDRALLVSHVDIEGKEIDRSEGLATEDLEQRRETVSVLQIDERRGRHGERTRLTVGAGIRSSVRLRD